MKGKWSDIDLRLRRSRYGVLHFMAELSLVMLDYALETASINSPKLL